MFNRGNFKAALHDRAVAEQISSHAMPRRQNAIKQKKPEAETAQQPKSEWTRLDTLPLIWDPIPLKGTLWEPPLRALCTRDSPGCSLEASTSKLQAYCLTRTGRRTRLGPQSCPWAVQWCLPYWLRGLGTVRKFEVRTVSRTVSNWSQQSVQNRQAEVRHTSEGSGASGVRLLARPRPRGRPKRITTLLTSVHNGYITYTKSIKPSCIAINANWSCSLVVVLVVAVTGWWWRIPGRRSRTKVGPVDHGSGSCGCIVTRHESQVSANAFALRSSYSPASQWPERSTSLESWLGV